MIMLVLTLCTSAAMDDCKVTTLGQTQTVKQCETVAEIHRKVLGPEENYRLRCEPKERK